jgi:putative endonuclease
VRTTQAVGRYGERVAVDRLERSGFLVLDRNWRCRYGELDVVALDGDCLVAVEVKTRRSLACGHPFEAVTPVKAARLRRLVARWLAEHDQHYPSVRVDVVAVLRPRSGPAVVEHLRGVA